MVGLLPGLVGGIVGALIADDPASLVKSVWFILVQAAAARRVLELVGLL